MRRRLRMPPRVKTSLVAHIAALALIVGVAPLAQAAILTPMGTWTNGDPGGLLSDIYLLGAASGLGDGTVVAAGGLVATFPAGFPAQTLAQRYNPATNSWSATGSLNTARWSLDAIQLDDGRALFAGGAVAFGGAVLSSAEIYDPVTGTFTLSSSGMSVARHALGVSKLNDGRILYTGGSTAGGSLGGAGVTAVDIYNPLTDTFTAAASLNLGRSLHAQTTLKDGRVVVVGGAQTDAEVYNPTTNTWTSSVNTMTSTLKDMKAFETFDGRVFIPAGQNTVDGVTTDATWFFDPDTGLFSPGPSMAGFNYAPPGTTVQVGTSDYSAWDIFADDPDLWGQYILVAGGEHDPAVGADVELHSASVYDVAHDVFFDIGPMPFVHDDHTEASLGLDVNGDPEFLLFGGNTGPGTSRFTFDRASIVPEPSTYLLGIMTVVCLVGYSIGRKRRQAA